jgi:excinuclease ABC subunit C
MENLAENTSTTLSSHIKETISALPETPGVYVYFDKTDTIIYVGKAKNLKKRVSSYFNKNHEYFKTTVLVRQIAKITYIVVGSEEDALLLENNLIKKLQPKYNILLKDGKTYPWLMIKNEAFPRILKTRKRIEDGSQYFGPYASGFALKTLMDFLQENYQLRTCHLDLNPDKINGRRYKVCLKYHIKNCKAPCAKLISARDYQKNIDEISEILKGNIVSIKEKMKQEMLLASSELRFEEAQTLKEKLFALDNYQAKSVIVNPSLHNIDVFGYESDENAAYINILRVSNGSIVQAYTIEYRVQMNEEKEEILALAILELRERFDSQNSEIIVPFLPEDIFKDIHFTIPKGGDKKKLLDLSTQNVKQYKLDKLKQAEKLNPEQKQTKILQEIQNKLHLDNLPIRIEAFDNSNIQGDDAVAACVVFVKGKPAKSEYRKFLIKTVVGADDYASMKEVVHRRYSRAISEGSPLPDLIITDGGRGQMEVVRQVIEDELQLKIPIAGLAKNDKHRTRELLFGFPPKEIGLKANDTLFKLLSNIQDEVHRFAIKFHREKRSKRQTVSELDSIKGIGEKTKEELMQHFKSLKRAKSASLEELSEVIGNNKASVIYKHFIEGLTA